MSDEEVKHSVGTNAARADAAEAKAFEQSTADASADEHNAAELNSSKENKAKKFDTFVFDLDGTLLDTLPDLAALTNRALADFNLPIHTQEEIGSYVGNGAKALISLAVPPESPHDLAERVLAHWKSLYPSLGRVLTCPYPLMCETLSEMKARGIKLAVVSNKFDEGTQDCIGAFFPGIFDYVLGESSRFPRKPDPAALLYVLDKLGSSRESCVYVGDSLNDAEVSRRAGVSCLLVGWGYGNAPDLCERYQSILIRKAGELLDFCR